MELKSAPAFKLGNRVKIRHTAGMRARIVELRGPLGPGDVQIYGIRVRVTSQPTYIEVREDQLVLIAPKPDA
ncbi:MAG TPA: hypothetical protein VND64_34720 [Pirellulales bacterium]|nr:hypothetical protein [Pirellulales bacterium]